MTNENKVRSILSELDVLDIDVELDTSCFNSETANSTITVLLDKINCVDVTKRGVRGVSNKFIRIDKPTQKDQSVCKNCSRLEVGCPIYEKAIDPNFLKANDPSI